MPRFITGCISRIPTEKLIDCHHALSVAYNDYDLEAVSQVIERLAEYIRQFTEIPGNMHFVPSASSAVAIGIHDGILVNPDGTDIQCDGGYGISEALENSAPHEHCEKCPHFNDGCDPEHMCIRLKGGFVYDGDYRLEEDLVELLRKNEKKQEA